MSLLDNSSSVNGSDKSEDLSNNIHKFKYYETYRRQYLHNAPFLTNEEFCEYFNIKRNTLDHYCSTKGWISYTQPTNKRFFLREDINAFLKRRRKEAIND